MLVYYISHTDYADTFDECFSGGDIWAEKYGADSIPSLPRFAVSERALRDAKHLIINTKGTAFTNADILECAKRLGEYSSCRLTVLGDDTEDFAQLVTALAQMNIRNTIIYSEVSNFSEVISELRECLSEGGKSFSGSLAGLSNAHLEMMKSSIMPSLHLPDGVRIGVAGVLPRIGVTWQCIGICDYLSFMGSKPLLIDTGGRLISSLKEVYCVKEDNDMVMRVSGISIASEDTHEHFSPYIVDFGVLCASNKDAFAECDVRILVCGSAPWELGALAAALELCLDTMLFFSFTSQSTLEEIGELPMLASTYSVCVPMQSDLWERRDKSFYNTVLYPVLRELKA